MKKPRQSSGSRMVERGRYRVIVPYISRGKTPEICYNIYPIRGCSPYTYRDAIDVLEIFNSRWLANKVLPDDDLEPWAEETDDWKKRSPGAAHRHIFTLRQVRPLEHLRSADEMDGAKEDERTELE